MAIAPLGKISINLTLRVGTNEKAPLVASSIAIVPRLANTSVTANLALDDKFIPSTTRLRAI